MYKKSKIFLEQIVSYNLKNNINFKDKISIILVSHILPDKLDFIETLSNYFKIEFIIPKPNSIDKNTLEKINNKFKILKITRNEIYSNKEKILEEIVKIKNDIIFIDIWWYFSKISYFLSKKLWSKIIWIIEDTENWHQKYEKIIKQNKIPIISVARSKLKEWEDFLIWQSIVFSTDYVLRLNNSLLKNKNTWIIWFWKIWKSIATELKWKNIQLWIYDIDYYKGVEILTYWYKLLNKNKIIKESDIIFLATWNFSLSWKDFEKLKDWVILSSVTSSDDEIDIEYLKENYEQKIINKYTVKYYKKWKSIYLLNWWNAINFINNAVVWEFIFLVQAEIIHWIFYLINNKIINKNKIITLDNVNKKYIPKIWVKNFNF